MQVGLLGPVEVQLGDGRAFAPAGARPRALLARLALAPGSALSRATLASALWGDEPPAANALHTVVARLRRSLAKESEEAAALLRSHPSGYALAVTPAAVDAVRAEQLATTAGERLGAGDPHTARGLTAEALGLWRGEPLVDVADAPFAAAAARQLAELRLRLEEQAVEAALLLGDDVDIVDLQELAQAHPLREHLQVLLVRALYAAGRQADALASYQRTRRLLVDELGIDPTPELEETHLAVLRQDGEVRPRARRPVGRRSRLPTQITSFVGRHAELAQVAEALRASRLVTIVGPGGAGKTRLASEATRSVEAEHADGAFFVELAPVQDPAELPSAVLGALGLRERGLFNTNPEIPPPPETVDLLVDSLATAHVLLVLDNCEHLVAAAAHLADTLLATCPHLHVLTTSREPLAITGEQLCPLPPLAVPPAEVSAADAADYAAVQLFTDRARTVRPGFAVTGANVGAVAQICRRLDGLPLAVELAAARLRTMPAEQVADRLDDRFRLLTAGSRTAMPRHQTLSAVVAWSWELLDKPERLLLARLAVFAGPATLEDVEATCADDDLPVATVFDVLSTLVDKSLVDATGDTEVRYRLLETVRAYAGDRLAESGRGEEHRRRHADHVLRVARTAEPRLRTREQLSWLARLDGLREDITAVLRWSSESGDADLAAALVAAVGWYWTLRGLHSELRHWPHRVLAMPSDTESEDRVVVGLYDSMAGAAEDIEGMRKAADQALDRVRRLGRTPAHPFAVMLEPMAMMLRDDQDTSMRMLTDVVENHPDAWTRATGRLFRSRLAENRGDGVTAAADEDLLYDTYRELGDRWGLAIAAAFVADRYARGGDFEQALDSYRTALRYMREMGSVDDEAQTLVRMAEVHAAAGQFEEARAMLRASTELPVNFWQHLPIQRAGTLAGHADVARREGDLDEAVRLSVEAVELVETTSPPTSRQLNGTLYVGLAGTYLARGDLDLANVQLRKAWDTAELAPDRPLSGQVVEGWASWALASGDAELGARLLGMSQAVFGTVSSPNLHRPAIVHAIESALGADAFLQAYADGAAYPHDDVHTWLRDWLSRMPDPT